MRTKAWRWLAAIAWLGAAAPAAARLPVTIEKVALEGEAAPGTASTFTGFRSVRISDAGEVSFIGDLANGHTIDGLWRWTSGAGLMPVIVAGQEAPGSPGSTLFAALDGHVFPTARGLMFGAQVIGASYVYGRTGGGALALVARDGDPAPGGGFFATLGNWPMAASAAGIVFRNTASGSFTGGGIFRQSAADTAELVARDTQPAPGIPGRFLCDLTTPLVNDAGGLLFTASIDSDATAGCQPPAESVLYGPDGAGGLAVVAKTGDAAPDTGGGSFDQLGARGVSQIYLGLDGANRVSVAATATGGSIVDTKWGIWGPDGGGGLRLLAMEGGAAPGTAGVPAIAWSTFANVRLTESARGDTVFRPEANAGFAIHGIWAAPVGAALNLVAVEGQALADPVAGTFFSVPPFFETNGNGDVVFAGQLGVGFSDVRDGLWLGHASGGTPDLLLVSGDLIDVGGGLTRELVSVVTANAWSGGDDGKGQGLNDARQMALLLRFTDGTSGVYRVRVPEPGAAASTLAAIAALRFVARRRPKE